MRTRSGGWIRKSGQEGKLTILIKIREDFPFGREQGGK